MDQDEEFENSSQVVGRSQCPSCAERGGDRSQDNLTLYADGHAHCFACGFHKRGEGSYKGSSRVNNSRGKFMPTDLIQGSYQALTKRGISEETCSLYGYQVSESKGCHVANYRDEDGDIVAQKLRYPDKKFPWKGDHKAAVLFGQHLWKAAGKLGVVVTEGEIDALTVSQLQGNKWPVVSLRNGAGGAEKDIKNSLQWLESFATVTLCFDMDEPGQEAANKVAALFSPGKVRIARLPLKDPNEMLQAGRGKELLDCLFRARQWRPEGIKTLDDLREAAFTPVQSGLSWPWQSLTDLTHGRRYGEVYTIGAGTGTGKTDVMLEIIQHTALTHKEKSGLFFFETSSVELAKRVVGKASGNQYHLPSTDGKTERWTEKGFEKDYNQVSAGDYVYIFDHFGTSDWEIIKGYIRYMARSLDVKHIYIDHLTALAAHADDERRFLDGLMEEISSLAQELQVCMYCVSHLSTPEGKPHEEGGRVMQKHFRGSRAIAQWSHYMFGLERDQQHPNLVMRRTITFRLLKARFDGSKNGEVFWLRYDPEQGKNMEVPNPELDFDDDAAETEGAF